MVDPNMQRWNDEAPTTSLDPDGTKSRSLRTIARWKVINRRRVGGLPTEQPRIWHSLNMFEEIDGGEGGGRAGILQRRRDSFLGKLDLIRSN